MFKLMDVCIHKFTPFCVCLSRPNNSFKTISMYKAKGTAMPAKDDSDVMFCLQSY